MEAIKYKERYSYSDYIEWEGRWELIDGVAYNMAPAPYPKHQRAVANIWRELEENLNCQSCEVYISPIDWKIEKKDVTVKYELYQKNGVKYYIMVVPDSEVTDIFILENVEYKFLKKAVDEVITFEWENCSTKIDFGKLFGK